MKTHASPGTVVWQSPSLVLVDKAPLVLTVPGRQGEADPRPVLGRWLEGQLGERLWPVHRLDLEVSGLVLFARTAQAHRVASRAFELRQVKKTYEALTSFAGAAPVAGERFTWQSKLVRGKRRSFEAPHGQWACTHATCEGVVDAAGAGEFWSHTPLCRWRLEPETGKPHQLRVHLANAGHPITGDRLYGGAACEAPGIALRAVELHFTDEAQSRLLGLTGPLQVPRWFGGEVKS